MGADDNDENQHSEYRRGQEPDPPPHEDFAAPRQRLAVALQLDLHGSSAVLSSEDENLRSSFLDAMRRARALTGRQSGKQWKPAELRWDSIRACFSSVSEAAACALALNHLFADPDLQLQHGLPELPPRIAVHVGLVHEPPSAPDGDAFATLDSVEKRVTPGEIWLTEQAAVLASRSLANRIEYIGAQTFPKIGRQYLYKLVRGVRVAREGRPSGTVARQADAVSVSLDVLEHGSEAEQDGVLAAFNDVVDQRACDALLQVAESSTRPFRQIRLALLSLQRHVSPDITIRLVGLLEADTREPSRRLLLQLLGRTGDESALPAILRVIENGDASVETREAAFLAGHALPVGIHGARLRRAIGNELNDLQEPLLVRAAAVAAANVRGKSLTESLTRVVLNEELEFDVRGVALEAVLSVPRLPTGLRNLAADVSASASLREPVLDRLALTRAPDALEVLQEVASRGGDPLRGYAAAQLLSASGAATRPRPLPTTPSSWIAAVLREREEHWERGA